MVNPIRTAALVCLDTLQYILSQRVAASLHPLREIGVKAFIRVIIWRMDSRRGNGDISIVVSLDRERRSYAVQHVVLRSSSGASLSAMSLRGPLCPSTARTPFGRIRRRENWPCASPLSGSVGNAPNPTLVTRSVKSVATSLRINLFIQPKQRSE